MIERNYETCLEELNRTLNFQKEIAIPLEARMEIQRAYLRATGYSLDDLDKLRIIHVAGSKGKGTTCSYIESILRHEGYRTGLLTSPHLVNVEERIRVNGEPVSRELFAEHFWLLHDKFTENANKLEEYPKPLYLSYLLHMAYAIFITQKVDVAIMEVGLGGRYDNTNIVRNPRVTVVTAIELEHTQILGNTIREIAWNKAGIFKPGVPAVVARDEPMDAMSVFVTETNAVGSPLVAAPSLADIRSAGSPLPPELEGQLLECVSGPSVKERNVCLALAAVSLWHRDDDCDDWLVTRSVDDSNKNHDPKAVPTLPVAPTMKQLKGICSARVVGRFQELKISEHVTFFFDCAHTNESIEHCSQWFEAQSPVPTGQEQHGIVRILMFTVTGPRDPLPMLKTLEKLQFDAVYFAGYVAGPLVRTTSKLPIPAACERAWVALGSQTPSCALDGDCGGSDRAAVDVTEAVRRVRCWDGLSPLHLPLLGALRPVGLHLLVTGSVYLVGDVLSARPNCFFFSLSVVAATRL